MEPNTAYLRYVLFIGGKMFFKDIPRTDRPRNGSNFSMHGLVFICRNKHKNPEAAEPVIGEIDAVRHSPVYRAIDVLISEGWMECSEEEREEILSLYTPGLKTVSPIMEIEEAEP